MRKLSLIILGLVALVRAFPNPQDEDLAILDDIAGDNAERYLAGKNFFFLYLLGLFI